MMRGDARPCKLVPALLALRTLTGAAFESGERASTLLAVRPVRPAPSWWSRQDCFGDVEYVVDLLNDRLRADKPLELRIEIINHCQRCNKPIQPSSRLWIEDSQRELPHFSKASAPLDGIQCHERRYVVVNVFAARRNHGVSQLPVRLNITLQEPRGYDVPEGYAVVDMPFYAYQSMFEAEQEVNILAVGPPGVGKTTFLMWTISSLLEVPQQLQNVGGATLEGHTTRMITLYPLADWTENARLRINYWDTWGLRPQNFSNDLLTSLCEGVVPHGFEMQAYEQGEKQFRKSMFAPSKPMDVVVFFLRADQVKHPEGLPAIRGYLNHVKKLGYGALVVVTWLHTVPDPDSVLEHVKSRLQIPVFPFAKGCHPNCAVQPPSRVSSVASEKDPEVDKHALVVLEWARRLATSTLKVKTTASWPNFALAYYRSFASRALRFGHWVISAAWGGETAIVLVLSVLAMLTAASRSGWALLTALHIELAAVPPHRRRELVASPALRTLLVALSLLYSPVQQSLPSKDVWAAHGSRRCAPGIDTVQISSAYSATSEVTSRKCREECLSEPECMMYTFGSSEGIFSTQGTHCKLFSTCELQHSVGTTVFERPVQSWLVSLSAFAYVAQMVLNFLRLICLQCSGACLMCTVVLCFLSVHLCWGAPPSSRFGLTLMLHLANVLVLLAMNQQLRERLQALTNEEASKEERLKELEVMLFREARRHGASLQDRQAWLAQVDLLFGFTLTASIVGLLAYCTVSFSGGDGIWAYNLANLVTRLVVGVNLQAGVRACVLVIGTFVLASPLVVGLRQVQRGLLGLLEDQQAELERSAAVIAMKAFTVENMLNCLKQQLCNSNCEAITRSELEDMADGLCLRRSSPDRSALICASATYFRHGPDDDAACRMLQKMVALRAVDLLQDSVDAARMTSEMLFAQSGDFCRELAAAESEAAERLSGACNALLDVIKTVGTGGLYLIWCCQRRRLPPPKRPCATDQIGETIRRWRNNGNGEDPDPRLAEGGRLLEGKGSGKGSRRAEGRRANGSEDPDPRLDQGGRLHEGKGSGKGSRRTEGRRANGYEVEEEEEEVVEEEGESDEEEAARRWQTAESPTFRRTNSRLQAPTGPEPVRQRHKGQRDVRG